jgi:hypothetical protein
MAADDQPRNGLRLTHAVRPFPVVLPALPDELLSSWFQRHANFYGVSGGWLLRHCALRHGRGVVAKSGFHPDCQRPTPTRISLQERSADHSEDDAVVRPKLPGCTDRDGSTNAGMQTLPRASPSGVGDPGRSVAKLDGGLAPELPLMWQSHGGLSSAEPDNEGGSGRPAARVSGRACGRRRADQGQAVRRNRAGTPFVTLMRSLKLPRARPLQRSPVADIPRLLEMVVPGLTTSCATQARLSTARYPAAAQEHSHPSVSRGNPVGTPAS